MTHPSNLVTDYLLAALCLLLGARLLRRGRAGQSTALQLWAVAYFAIGVAALTGGTYHGLSGTWSEGTALVLWKCTVYAIGAASFAMLAGSICGVVRGGRRRWLALVGLKSAIYAWWMLDHDAFAYAIVDYGISIAGVILLYAYQGLVHRVRGSAWIAAGMLVAVAGAVLQQAQVRMHENFDHNDLYHVIQMGAIVIVARGLLDT